MHCRDHKGRQLRQFNLIYTSDWPIPRSLSSAGPSTKILYAFLTSPNSSSLGWSLPWSLIEYKQFFFMWKIPKCYIKENGEIRIVSQNYVSVNLLYISWQHVSAFLNRHHHAMWNTGRLLRKHNQIFHWYVVDILDLQYCVCCESRKETKVNKYK